MTANRTRPLRAVLSAVTGLTLIACVATTFVATFAALSPLMA